jgi:hypothetical protein
VRVGNLRHAQSAQAEERRDAHQHESGRDRLGSSTFSVIGGSP